MARKRVRAVVFDAVGTLITPKPAAGDVYHEVGRRHGLKLSVEEVRGRFGAAFGETLRENGEEPYRTDEPTERRFWQGVVGRVFEELPGPAVTACFDELFAHFGRAEAWRVYRDVGPGLAALDGAGFLLAVASNFDARLHAVFEGHAELGLIERRFVSSELGWRKPDRRFFAAVCEGLGCSADEVLYVGDEPELDVAGAREAGLRAVLLCRGGRGASDVLTGLEELVRWVGCGD